MINARYKIIKKLGEGRSKVFLCKDIDLSGPNEIAIKILHESAAIDEIKKFKDEYFTIKKLLHPNIIKAYDYGTVVRKDEEDVDIKLGSKFITIEYFNGADLAACDQNLLKANLKEIINQVCSILYYLHQSNFIYYDLKPENILLNFTAQNPIVKIIDFGFIRNISSNPGEPIRGSVQYIAPEILKNEKHDHQVDLYSLGMILYRIIYGRFPFDSYNELDIYKAQISRSFEFPETDYPDEIIKVTKKLLEKNPEDRYKLSLEVINDLGFEINERTAVNFAPAKVFTDRLDVLNILKKYLSDERSTEIFSLRGYENSGKTTIIDEVNLIYDESVLIRNEGTKSSIEFLNYLLKKIAYSGNIYSNLPSETVLQIEQLLNNPSSEITDSLRQIFAAVSGKTKFILLMDDFNLYDTFILDIFKEVIPILQVNKIKIIITENSDIDYESDLYSNVRTIDLTPFTEKQLAELLYKSFFKNFPLIELKKLIMMYADLYPGNIVSFVEDLILLNVLKFRPEGPVIKASKDINKILSSSHDEIYKYRLRYLNDEEIAAVRVISSFDIAIDENILGIILRKDVKEITEILNSLKVKTILLPKHLSSGIEFSSDGIKRYIYNNIPDKKQLNLHLAEVIRRQVQSFNRMELARHFEKGEDYYSCYEVLHEEETEAEKISAFSYQKSILQRELSLPLQDKLLYDLKFSLAKLHYKLNEYQPALEIINELLANKENKSLQSEMLAIKGSSLIELGQQEEGRRILNQLLIEDTIDVRKQKILIDIAHAEFDLNNYQKAREICKSILSDNDTNNEERGRCFNLLGLIKYKENDNKEASLNEFNNAMEEFKIGNLTLKMSRLEVNLGNISFFLNDIVNAEYHWNKALELNRKLGNLDQEGNVLIGYGYYYFEQMKIKEALEKNQRAFDIFLSLGNKNGQGLSQKNLAEIFLSLADYQNSLNSINSAIGTFEEIHNNEKVAESIFILGKILFWLGDNLRLEEIINRYKELLKSKNFTDIHKNNIQLLTCLLKIKTDFTEIRDEHLSELGVIYNKIGEMNNYLLTIYNLIQFHIVNHFYDKSLYLLNSDELKKVSARSPFYEAERLYWLGMLAKKFNTPELNESISYFNKSMNILESQIINELTWKVTYELYEYYINRGNLNKALIYGRYTAEIINHFALKITDHKLKNIFLEESHRKKVISTLNSEISNNKIITNSN